MHIAALILGVVSILFMVGGVFATAVPVLGSVLSFGGPLLSLGGIVTAGIAMSRLKRAGEPTGIAVGGLILNIVAFILSLLVAVTCGLCNALITTAEMENEGEGSVLEQAFGQAMASAQHRMSVGSMFAQMGQQCQADPLGSSAETFFLEGAFEPHRDTICDELTPAIANAFARDCAAGPERPCSTLVPMSAAELPEVAAFGVVDATRCFRLNSGTATVISCRNASEQVRFAVLRNLSGVQ